MNTTRDYVITNLVRLQVEAVKNAQSLYEIIKDIIEIETGKDFQEYENIIRENTDGTDQAIDEVMEYLRRNRLEEEPDPDYAPDSGSMPVIPELERVFLFHGSLNVLEYNIGTQPEEVTVLSDEAHLKEKMGADIIVKPLENIPMAVVYSESGELSEEFRGVTVTYPFLLVGYDQGFITSLTSQQMGEIILNYQFSTVIKDENVPDNSPEINKSDNELMMHNYPALSE